MNASPALARIDRAFSQEARSALSAAYPDHVVKLRHQLCSHPLLKREALALLGDRLPEKSVEYNLGNLPLGISAEDTPDNGLSIGETIHTIDANGSWAVLKNVEQDADYAALLDYALADIETIIAAHTGEMAHREAFIFLSSPGSVTPFHIDPEHNILLQIEGEKAMTVFPQGDEELVPAHQSEHFHAGGHRNLTWNDAFDTKGQTHQLLPGDALYVPVKAPHFVRNGRHVSVSFSITWRSERSVAEGELHSLNASLRRLRLPVAKVSAQPEGQAAHRLLHRIIRRLGV